MFAHLPLVHHHPQNDVDKENYRRLALGWTGETPSAVFNKDKDEVFIENSLVMADKEAQEAYGRGERQVSPGYDATFKWFDGKTKVGREYQIVMESIDSVNHLALVPTGRGGPDVRILDSAGGAKLKSGLLHSIMKFFGVKDTDMGEFRIEAFNLLQSRESASPEEIEKCIGKLHEIASTLPDTSDKDRLTRFIEDLKVIPGLGEPQAKKMAEEVADLFERLDTSAMEDGMSIPKQESTKDDASGVVKKVGETTKKVVEGSAENATKDTHDLSIENAAPSNPFEQENAPVKKNTVKDLSDDPSTWSVDERKYFESEVLQFMKGQARDSDPDPKSVEGDKEDKTPEEKDKDKEDKSGETKDAKDDDNTKEAVEEEDKAKKQEKKDDKEVADAKGKTKDSLFNAPISQSKVGEDLMAFYKKNFKGAKK